MCRYLAAASALFFKEDCYKPPDSTLSQSQEATVAAWFVLGTDAGGVLLVNRVRTACHSSSDECISCHNQKHRSD